ncbi:MAG TPA: tyrosine-type recombinase/integrase [Gemmataceae bacterium]|nr:tyrosine-type recombinase/integrase [Gemmataceae bacterium]
MHAFTASSTASGTAPTTPRAKDEARLVDTNPVAGVAHPRTTGRGRKALVTPEQHARVLAAVKSRGLREMLVALENTGARPGELYAASAADWGDEDGAIVYHAADARREDEYAHKNAGQGKDRVIFFTGDALAMMRELVRRRPTGTLFRTRRGGAWDTATLNSVVAAVRKRVGLPHLVPYSYRHSFITAPIKAGNTAEIVAEWVGNSPATIYKHYLHLFADRAHLRSQLKAFRSGGEK